MNRRPRSHLRNPILRRIHRHTSVATMLRGKAPQYTIARDEVNRLPIEIVSPPTSVAPEFPLPQEIETQAAETPQAQVQRQPISPASPSILSNTPGTSQPPDLETLPTQPTFVEQDNLQPVVERPTPVQPEKKSSWSIPNIFRQWQENRASAKAAKTEKTPSPVPPQSVKTGDTTQPPAPIQAKPVAKSTIPVSKETVQPDQPQSRTVVKSEQPDPMSSPPVIQRDSGVTASSSNPPSQQSLPVSPLPEEPASTDPAWERLQNIMRKHEEKQAPAESSPSPLSQTELSHLSNVPEETPKPAQGSQPTPDNVIQAQAMPPKPAPTAPNVPQAQALPPSPAPVPTSQSPAIPPEDNDPDWRRLQTIMRKHQEKATEETAGILPTTPPVPSAKSSASTPPSRVQKSPQPPQPPKTASPSSSPPRVVESPLNSVPEPAEAANDQTEIFFNESKTEPTAEQPFSLENVWPVQRAPLPVTPTPASSPEKSLPAELSSPPLDPNEEAVVRKVTQSAKTEQPTDSNVELILPRSPRPSSLQKATQPQPVTSSPKDAHEEPSSSSPTHSSTAPIIQRESRPTPEPARSENPSPSSPPVKTSPSDLQFSSPQPEPGNPVFEPVPKPTSPVVQAKPAPVTPTPPTHTPEASPMEMSETMIPTDIGPLPSDLWNLIGQPRPSTQPPAEASNPPSNPPPTATAAPVQLKPQPEVTQPPVHQAPVEEVKPPHRNAPVAETPGRPAKPTASPSPPPPTETIQRSANPQPTSREQPVSRTSQMIQREELGQPADQNTSSTSTERGEGSAMPTLSDQQLDTIARQVYSEIRHQLSIERERIRGWTK